MDKIILDGMEFTVAGIRPEEQVGPPSSDVELSLTCVAGTDDPGAPLHARVFELTGSIVQAVPFA